MTLSSSARRQAAHMRRIMDDSFYASLENYKTPTNEEQIELVQVIQAGGEGAKEAQKQLIERNLRLVIYAAKRVPLLDGCLDFNDLIQEGVMGIVKAATYYDPTRGASFSTYAYICILRTVIAARNSAISRVVNLGPSAVNKLWHSAKDDPNMTMVKLRFAVAEAAGYSELLALEDNRTCGIDSVIESESSAAMRIRLAAALLKLSERERKVVEDRSHGCTLQGIGETMGITKERVRQIESKALCKLRYLLTENPLCQGQ